MVSMFVETLPIRVRFDDNPSFGELLCEVGGVSVGALDHQEIPFNRIVKELGANRDDGQPPLCQVMLVLQNYDSETPQLNGCGTMERIPEKISGAQFDITLIMREEKDGSYAVTWNYDAGIFDEETIRRMHGATFGAAAASKRKDELGGTKVLGY